MYSSISKPHFSLRGVGFCCFRVWRSIDKTLIAGFLVVVIFSIYRKATLNGDEARGLSLSAQDGPFPLFRRNTSIGGKPFHLILMLGNTKMKKITDPIEIRQAITRFGYKHNINMVTDWHNKLFVGINEAINELENLLEESNEKIEIGDIKSSIHIYENYISDNLRNFTLIMHLSNFEEISTLVCKEMKTPAEKGSSINRFQNGWEKKLERPLGDVSAWNTLKDAAKIRNAILHSAGRISLNRKQKDIARIIEKENLKSEHDRVYVTEEFLNKVRDAIWKMVQ